MGTITDKLNKLAETKSAIKTAIVNKGVSVSVIYSDGISVMNPESLVSCEVAVGISVLEANPEISGNSSLVA